MDADLSNIVAYAFLILMGLWACSLGIMFIMWQTNRRLSKHLETIGDYASNRRGTEWLYVVTIVKKAFRGE